MSAVSTVDTAEIERFSKLAADWWAPDGSFKPLHDMNPVRIAYVRDVLCALYGRDAKQHRPLENLRVLDIGCGGGLLCEPLARLGATVTGIDAAEQNVRTAAVHAEQHGLAIEYLHMTAEQLAATGRQFHAVTAMEIVEHVADVSLFLHACGHLVLPRGAIVLSTLNRTAKSFAMAIVGAEYVLRWLPPGTHDWRRFLRPSEVAGGLRRAGLVLRDLTGITYDPGRGSFSLAADDLEVNYILWAEKQP